MNQTDNVDPDIHRPSNSNGEGAGNDMSKNTAEKIYLETEIDQYLPAETTTSTPPPSPLSPRTTHKPFKIGSIKQKIITPDLNAPTESLYTSVYKERPKIPPKPSTRTIQQVKHLSLRKNVLLTPEPSSDELARVHSLPNLSPPYPNLHPLGPSEYLARSHYDFSPSGYGEITKTLLGSEKTEKPPLTPEYCDLIPDSPPYANLEDIDNIYEDVRLPKHIQHNLPGRPKFVPQRRETLPSSAETDYTDMTSPTSTSTFHFDNESEYVHFCVPANTGDHSVNEGSRTDIFTRVFEPPQQFSTDSQKSSSVTSSFSYPPDDPSYRYENIPTENFMQSSAASSLTDQSPSLSSAKSIATTATSSFQGIQVCYFPPSDLYNTSGVPDQPASPTSTLRSASSSSNPKSLSRQSSRSKIPVPVSRQPAKIGYPIPTKVPDELAPPIPSFPTNSPPPTPKISIFEKFKKNHQPTTTPSQDAQPGGKPGRWYGKLNCAQTDSGPPSEPYGLPGERKRSKSVSKENRKSQFYLTFDNSEV